MDLDDRVFWFFIGCIVGFIVSEIIGAIRSKEEELTKMDEIEKGRLGRVREFIRSKNWKSIALAFVVLLTAFASFRSQEASNTAEDNRQQLAKVVGCIVISNTELLNAINTRTTFTQGQASANKTLQEAQKEFFKVLLADPPLSESRREAAARTYDAALSKFIEVAEKSENNAQITKYPESSDLLNCIREQKEE